jgi:replicative DNA helicase Mcm
LVKYRKVRLEDEQFPASTRLLPEVHYPVLVATTDDQEHLAFIEAVNKTVRQAIWHEQLDQFSKKAGSVVQQHLAPHILGMDHVKRAALLQLVMPERFHILLLGDPGTGKTDILRAASELSPLSSFGLGSGASKAGLSVSFVGKEVHYGILVQANDGLCCIDELNLMKVDDRAALYNAMEKGFVTYDKGSLHERFPADIRLLATANPKGDQFRGGDLKTLKNQLPFDAALLSRFHLVFIIRKPDAKQFRAISQQLVEHKAKPLSKDDIAFIHRYVSTAKHLSVSIPTKLEARIVDAVTGFKEKEKRLLFDITPRLTKGLVSLASAGARLELRTEVTEKDVEEAIVLMQRSLEG